MAATLAFPYSSGLTLSAKLIHRTTFAVWQSGIVPVEQTDSDVALTGVYHAAYTGANTGACRLVVRSGTTIVWEGDYNIVGTGVHDPVGDAWNPDWDAEVESEANDALVANNLDHLAGTATGIPAIPSGTYVDQLMDDGTAAFDRTTDSLQAQRDSVALTAQAVRDAMKLAPTAGTPTAGSIDKHLDDIQDKTDLISASNISIVGTVSGNSITVTLGTLSTIPLTALGNLATATELYFTVKESPTDADADALLQVTQTGGLERLNKSSTGLTASDASITINDATAGNITIVLKPNVTSQLPALDNAHADVKVIVSAANQSILSTYRFATLRTATRALT